MCGIAFLYSPEHYGESLCAKMHSALTCMAHRGPDDSRQEGARNAIAGHRRLSIIDLAGSIQPMRSPDQRYILVFNGEIYNFQELRTKLAAHWKFQTNGDTEVLLAGLLCEGTSFINRLEGMWAFALWDTAEEALMLCRDRVGKKPLYFSATQSGFTCASELPALRTLSDYSWHEDEDSTADYLRYGYFLPGYTAYREVREVLPGHILKWDARSRQPHQESYWQLRPKLFTGSKQQGTQLLRESLVEAVRRRLIADVEVGAFLSGGVDSSLIVGIATKLLGKPLKTFTIGFNNQTFDERVYAKNAALHFSTDHYSEELSSFSPETLNTLLVKHIGQPFQDSSLLPTALVSQVAARHVKVVLSGDGGDELFCGYQRYQARSILDWYTRLPRSLQMNAQRLLRRIPEPGSHHSHSLIKKAHLFCDVADRIIEETPYIAPLMFRFEDRIRLAPDLAKRGHPSPQLPESHDQDPISQMMLGDTSVYLPQDIMTKVDRASMAASLETRSPFLDREVIELAFSFPRRWHLHGLSGKRMLHAAFDDILPAWIWRRRKQGFAVPIHNWFREGLGDLTLRLQLETYNSPFKTEFLRSLLKEHQAGIRDHGYRLWLLHTYLTWKQGVA